MSRHLACRCYQIMYILKCIQIGVFVNYKLTTFSLLLAVTATLTGCSTHPSYSTSDIHQAEEQKGMVVIEAEHFSSQVQDDVRKWMIFSKDSPSHQLADIDPMHYANASEGKYIEILPDTRTNHNDKLIKGQNFSNMPGKIAVLSYPVKFSTPGKYYVWARAFSTGSEDNGVHIGLNDEWPESSQRLQLCKGKQKWTWSSAQRVKTNHCGVPNTISVTIPTAGVHNIMISMREDGFELDQLLLTQDKSFRPQGIAPQKPVQNTTTASKAESSTRPNVLFILADDHRWDMLGKFHSIVKTPNLDQLANQGTVFKNAFVTTPICASSRVSILTGLTERTHDFTFSRPKTGSVESANMYPNILKQAGYNTAFVGKYEIGISGDNDERFDFFKPLLQAKTAEYNGKTLPQTYYIAELAKEFIGQPEQSAAPWVMAVNFWDPHAHDIDQIDQYHYPEEFESWYDDVTIPEAKFSDDETYDALPDFLKRSIGRVRWQYRYSTPDMYQRMVKRYYRAISGVDKAVGMIYEKLQQTGMADNTVIVYMGDNGYNLNERQLAGKWFGWEEDLRVPLIVYDPRNPVDQGQEIDKMVLNIDIPSTIIDLSGGTIPSTYQGESFLPLLDQSQSTPWRDEFFFEHMYQPKRVFIPPTVGIRTEQWKYVDFYKNDFEQLYDLVNDPEEKYNLIDELEHQAIVKELSDKVDQYIQQYEAQRTLEVKQRESFINVRN